MGARRKPSVSVAAPCFAGSDPEAPEVDELDLSSVARCALSAMKPVHFCDRDSRHTSDREARVTAEPNTEGGQTADGRWNPPTNFGHLVGDLLGMRSRADNTWRLSAFNPGVASRHAGGRAERAQEPLEESLWSRPECEQAHGRAHKSRSRVAWTRPISAARWGLLGHEFRKGTSVTLQGSFAGSE